MDSPLFTEDKPRFLVVVDVGFIRSLCPDGVVHREHVTTLDFIINELSEAMTQKKGKEVVEKTLKGLIDYTRTHFSTEEKYFAQFRYPDAREHAQEHAAFVKKVGEFRDDYEKGRLGLSVEVMYFLRDWLKDHIQGVDKKYSAFFNANGLK